MVILGITAPLSWNSAAAIVKDGRLLAAVEEERFNGLKYSPRILPLKSIEYCLAFAKVDPSQVDAIALGYRSPIDGYFRSLVENLKERDVTRAAREAGAFAEYKVGTIRLLDWMKRKNFRLSGQKKIIIKYYAHHLVHAASAFRCSGFSNANVITLDGQGEDDSGSLWYGQKHAYKKMEKIGHHQSVGWVYSEATDVLGFQPHSHEGKVMGLAGWGKHVLDTTGLWKTSVEGYTLSRDWKDLFWKRFGPRRNRYEKITSRHKNIALTVQKFSEAVGVALAKKMYRKTASKNFCLAGGVALNCDMNAKIWELPFTENIFINPAANDTGTAIGGALELADELGENADLEMRHAYWGPAYTNSEIEETLTNAKLKYERVDQIEEYTAQQLATGKIIGWFQGRLEIGPRALGNRSILAHPGRMGMKDKINTEVKHREVWRPFAPSVLHEAGSTYFDKYCFHPFMVLAFNVKKSKVADISQTVHVDGTARVQSVEPTTNPRYYKLISEFAKISGIPALLNTSFNDSEQPLVTSPKDALRTFFSTGIDALAMGNYFVTKPKS